MNRSRIAALLPACLTLDGLLLLALGLLVACGTANAGATFPAAGVAIVADETLASTPTLDPSDKYAWDRAYAPTLTSQALRPAATTYWPYPTPTGVFTAKDWPPDIPYQPAGAGYILTGGYWGMSSSSFKDTNGWMEILPDRVIRVHAGGDGYMGDPTQGLLVISVRTPAPNQDLIGDFEMYRTPTKAGPITITDAVGERLTLQAADGTRFTFDVATRQWVDSPTAEVFTPTPTLHPNDKYAAAREWATQAAAVPSATTYWPLPTVTPDLTPAAWPPDALPYRVAGAGYIITGAPLGISSSNFKDTNLWAERLPDRFITVHAGGDGYAGDPMQGLLVISAGTPPPHRTQIGNIEYYQTPTKAGPVTITDAVGERLTLEAPDGTRFYFDVATRQWVNP